MKPKSKLDHKRLVLFARTAIAMMEIMPKILWELFEDEFPLIDCGECTDWEVLEQVVFILANQIWPEDENDDEPDDNMPSCTDTSHLPLLDYCENQITQ